MKGCDRRQSTTQQDMKSPKKNLRPQEQDTDYPVTQRVLSGEELPKDII